MVSWDFRAFRDLTAADLYAALRLRQLVFVVEQRCPYLDADGDDDRAWHLLGWTGDGARTLGGYARVFAPGVKCPEASFGRVVSHPALRRTGVGRLVVAEALRRIEGLAPGAPVRIGAQLYLVRFYEGFGFRREGDEYDEDGIMHVEMVRDGGAAPS
jgi:ElaA protein